MDGGDGVDVVEVQNSLFLVCSGWKGRRVSKTEVVESRTRPNPPFASIIKSTSSGSPILKPPSTGSASSILFLSSSVVPSTFPSATGSLAHLSE